MRNITVLNDTLIDGCKTNIISLNFNDSKIQFLLDSRYFNITSCETLNVSLISLTTTPKTTDTVPISDSSSTIGTVLGVFAVCMVVIIFYFLWRRRSNRLKHDSTAVTEHQHYFEIELDASIQPKKRNGRTVSHMTFTSVNPYASTLCNGCASDNLDSKSNIQIDNHQQPAVAANVSNYSLQNDTTKETNGDIEHEHYYSIVKDQQNDDFNSIVIPALAVCDKHGDSYKTNTPNTDTPKAVAPINNISKTDITNVYSHLGQTITNFTNPYDDIASEEMKRSLNLAQ